MKKIFLKAVVVLSSSLFVLACNDSTTEKTNTDSSSKVSETKMDTGMTKPAMINNDFVTTVANVGMMEVELGKVAQTNAASKDVKDFGKMMEDDHTAAGNELKDIATAENISFPAGMNEEHTMHVTNLSAKKGAEFDKAYMDMMVEGHTSTIDAFKKAIASNENQKVKDFAAKTLPTLQKHLDKAKAIKSKLK